VSEIQDEGPTTSNSSHRYTYYHEERDVTTTVRSKVVRSTGSYQLLIAIREEASPAAKHRA